MTREPQYVVNGRQIRFRNSRMHRRGAVFIIALAVTIILTALLLVYAQEMRTEALASANRVAAVQADGVEQGAEQWVLAQIEANTTPLSTSNSNGGTNSSSSLSGSSVDVTTIPAEAIQVGGGYFWLLRPDPTQDQTYAFGITDESAKLNLNNATADQLSYLPGMPQDVADSIVNWVSNGQQAAASDAATNDYYQSLSEPYQLKSAANTGTNATVFETLDELQLIAYCTPSLIYGSDLNHDGVIDSGEQAQATGAVATDATTNDRRGFSNYVTVYSTNATPVAVGATPAPVQRGVRNVGLININTASAKVLQTLPSLTATDVNSIVSGQTSATPGDTSWLSNVLTQDKTRAIGPYITATSYQYSADIVAVSGDGRAFKRVRIVVDCRKQPASIIYRKDLTSLGWPLPGYVKTSMRSGKGVPASVSGTTNAETGGGLNQ